MKGTVVLYYQHVYYNSIYARTGQSNNMNYDSIAARLILTTINKMLIL